MSKAPRIVLITSGLRRVAHFFPSLPGQPIGIINWNNEKNPKPSLLSANALTRRCHALIRRRQYATVQHLSLQNNLLFADIHKHDEQTLKQTLIDWKADLVITSNCSFVSTQALAHLSHGSLNMHPSWLPDYRGAEPVLWQVLAGEENLATSIHRLSDEYDCGGIVAQERTARPAGASQALLADITEAELGKIVLTRAIEKVIEEPEFNGVAQPAESPSPYAHRRNADALGKEVALANLSPATAWDIMHYYGKCPAPWLGLSGWRSKLVWKPDSFQANKNSLMRKTDLTDMAANKVEWTINERGLTLQLISDGSIISLKPSRS